VDLGSVGLTVRIVSDQLDLFGALHTQAQPHRAGDLFLLENRSLLVLQGALR
jgi:hypothetical protein